MVGGYRKSVVLVMHLDGKCEGDASNEYVINAPYEHKDHWVGSTVVVECGFCVGLLGDGV